MQHKQHGRYVSITHVRNQLMMYAATLGMPPGVPPPDAGLPSCRCCRNMAAGLQHSPCLAAAPAVQLQAGGPALLAAPQQTLPACCPSNSSARS